MEVQLLRENEVELKQAKKELEEKEEQVTMLDEQLEMLRKQIIIMKCSSQQNIYQSSFKLEAKCDSETQTTPIAMENGGRESSASSGCTSVKQNCCIIL